MYILPPLNEIPAALGGVRSQWLRIAILEITRRAKNLKITTVKLDSLHANGNGDNDKALRMREPFLSPYSF
jgi:hypothetical protein